MIKKIILVGFDNNLLSDSLIGLNINKGKFTHNTKTDICLREYAYYFTQLFLHNGVFFDYIFESIQKGILENDNIKNSTKMRESGVMDSYPVLINRINHLMSNIQGCLIISNINDNRYDYLIDILKCEKLYLSTEKEVERYISHTNFHS